MNLKQLIPLTVALVLALPAAAAVAKSTSQGPVYQPPQSYYLALGDSMAYGFQPTKAKPGAPPSDFDTGYVDVFAASLRKLSPKIQVVNYGCPGESTVTFARGGCHGLADGVKLHNAFRGSQLKAAQSFLRAHPGKVSPITVTLWGGDLFPLSAQRQARAERDRVVRCALQFDPSATSGRGAERRDHRERSVEPRGRSTRAGGTALPLGRCGDPTCGDGVARASREHVRGLQFGERHRSKGSALLDHLLLLGAGRSASERRRLPRDGRCLHHSVGLPAEAVRLLDQGSAARPIRAWRYQATGLLSKRPWTPGLRGFPCRQAAVPSARSRFFSPRSSSTRRTPSSAARRTA